MRLKILILTLTVFSAITSVGQDTTCHTKSLGNVLFEKGSSKLTIGAKSKLGNFITVIRNTPTCEIAITCYSPEFCDNCGSLSRERQYAVTSYLIKKGIPENRLRYLTALQMFEDYVTLTFISWPSTTHTNLPAAD